MNYTADDYTQAMIGLAPRVEYACCSPGAGARL